MRVVCHKLVNADVQRRTSHLYFKIFPPGSPLKLLPPMLVGEVKMFTSCKPEHPLIVPQLPVFINHISVQAQNHPILIRKN